MKFECDSCHAQYMIADEKLGTRGVKVKCKRCQHVIIVRPPPSGDEDAAADEADAGLEAAPPPPASDLGFSDDDFDGFGAGFDGPEAGATGETAFGGDTELGMDEPDDGDAPGGLDLDDDLDAPPSGFDATQVTPSPMLADDDAGGGADEEDEDDDDTLAASPGDDEGDDDFAPPPMGDDLGGASDDAFADPFAGAGGLAGAAGSGVDDEHDDDVEDDEPPAPFADPGFGGGGDFNFGGDLNLGASDDEPEAPPLSSDLGSFGATAEGPAFQNDTEMAPPMASLDDIPAPPSAPMGAMPASAGGLGDVELGAGDGGGADALDNELAGAFGALFDGTGPLNPPVKETAAARGPTQVVDINQMDQLRQQSLPTQMGGGSLDDLRSDLDSSLDAGFGGLGGGSSVPFGQDRPPPEEAEWHVAIDDDEVGPLTLTEVRKHIEAGRVDRESLAWKTGMDDWEALEDIPALNALFQKMPMPDIGRAGAVAGAFDVGAPIDDMPSSPFDSGPEPSDPFASAPDLGGADANWQPHGLTEVYQAANLAEATGGLGKAQSPVMPPAGGLSAPEEEEEDEGWKPGAASALASLVNDEISRIESGGLDEPSLPPAADDSLSIDSPLSLGGASSLGSLDLPSDPGSSSLGDLGGLPPAPVMPGAGSLPPMAGLPPSPATLGGMPMAPYQQPESPLKNPVILAAGGLGALVVLLLLVVVVVLIAKGDDKPAATPVAVAAPGAVPGAVPGAAPGAVPGAAPAVAPAAAPAAEPAAAAAAEPAAEEPAAAEPAAEEPAAEEATKVAMASKPKPKPRSGSKPSSSSRASKPEPKVEPPPTRSRGSRDCDPVLDFDCPEGGARKSSGGAKATLSPADVLTVVRKNLGSVNACGKQHGVTGTVKMEWRILKSGNTTAVKVITDKYAGTPVGECMVKAVKRWKFPAYTGAPPPPVKFPFKLK